MSQNVKATKGNQDLWMSASILAILSLLIVALPPFVLDMLLAVNVTVAAMILLGIVYLISPIEMSSFPSYSLIVRASLCLPSRVTSFTQALCSRNWFPVTYFVRASAVFFVPMIFST